jgi:pilus assembly protein CpaF
MTSGHDGCLAVLHAGTPSHAVARLEMMVLSRGMSLPVWAIQRQIGEAVDLIIQMALMADGSRKVTHVTDVVGIEDADLKLRDLFRFEHSIDEAGVHQGNFFRTSAVPSFIEKLRRADPATSAKLYPTS